MVIERMRDAQGVKMGAGTSAKPAVAGATAGR